MALSTIGKMTAAGYPAGLLGGEGGPTRVSVLGATGSVGESTLDLIGRDPGRYQVVALTANANFARLAELAIVHKAKFAVVADKEVANHLRGLLNGTGIRVAAGHEALVEAASEPADWVMAAIVGAAGLAPTLAAVRQGRKVALANKECLVTAGAFFIREVTASGATLLPVDSEHSAAFQAIVGMPKDTIERMVLTASGGPFREWSRDQIAAATPAQALKHPNWNMGQKVTIDSASLMNKGLELIEAHHLFGIEPSRLGVLVHPQSVVHCLIECHDGSVMAQLSSPDMRVPIAYALGWPHRLETPVARLDLAKLGQLTFEAPDTARFPALGIAQAALERGGGACAVLNAANEVAVAAFLDGRIGFLDIPAVVTDTLDRAERSATLTAPASLEEATQLDFSARQIAFEFLHRRAA